MPARAVVLGIVLLAGVAMSSSAAPRVAVSDFGVSSENPRLKFVGKGLAEMIAVELSGSSVLLGRWEAHVNRLSRFRPDRILPGESNRGRTCCSAWPGTACPAAGREGSGGLLNPLR